MKINSIYITLFLGIIALYFVAQKYIIQSSEFYGIAENQIRSINLEYPIEIKDIKVALGERIETNQALAIVERTDLPIKFNNLNIEIRELELKKANDLARVNGEIEKLTASKKLIQTNFSEKIKALEVEQSIQIKLLSSIQTFDIKNIDDQIIRQKIAALQNQYFEENKVVEAEINKAQIEYKGIAAPIEAKIAKISNELNLLKKQESDLKIFAPQSGIIGELLFQKGDKVNAYTVLMKIYDTRPNIVTTYIGEGNLAEIKLHQELMIYSIHDPNYKIKGKVVGLGNRVAMLPERLRKIPELKTWGREIQLQIPSDNLFLQGEKVKILFK